MDGWSPRHGPDRTTDTCARVPGVREIPKQKWTGIIDAAVRASVEELAHMNRIRFSTCSQNSIFDSDDPKSAYASHENLLSVGSKSKIPKDSEDLRARQIRWKQINGDQRLQAVCSMVPPTTEIDARPLPLCDASTTWMLCSWGNPLYFCITCLLMCACMCLCMCVSVYV